MNKVYRANAARIAAVAGVLVVGAACGPDDAPLAPTGPSAVPSNLGAGAPPPTPQTTAQPHTAGPDTNQISRTSPPPTNAGLPARVDYLMGIQVHGENSVRLTWNPPLSNGVADTTVTSYSVVRDSSDTLTVPTSNCDSSDCQYTIQHLSHDLHTFSVAATNASGTGENVTVLVNVVDTLAPGAPLTATFGASPDHDAQTSFSVSLTFSEDVETNDERVRDAIDTTNGTIDSTERRNRASKTTWNLTVTPTAADTITLTIGPANANGCGTTSTICTSDGRALGEKATKTIALAPHIPTSVENLNGQQNTRVNSMTITWNPPTRNGHPDRSVTHYRTVRENSEQTTVQATTCTTAATPVCSVVYDSLTYDPHTVVITPVNPTGYGPTETVTVNIVDPNPPTPLTATFTEVPNSHDGTNRFRFKLTFSENFALSYRVLRNQAFDIAGGRIRRARRVTRGNNTNWWITIQPNRYDDVELTLPGNLPCGNRGAICTADGRQLSEDVNAYILVVQ